MPRGRPRSTDTREATSRASEVRESPKPSHVGRFYIPPHVIPKNMTYAWVATAFDNAGTPNSDNFRTKYRNGWRPVPRDRHPDLFPSVPNIGFGADDDELIKEGGQVLCEKLTRDVEKARNDINKKTQDQMDGINWAQGQNMNPFSQTMPRRDFGSTPTEFKHSAEFKDD
jgi:hypothetical protein